MSKNKPLRFSIDGIELSGKHISDDIIKEAQIEIVSSLKHGVEMFLRKPPPVDTSQLRGSVDIRGDKTFYIPPANWGANWQSEDYPTHTYSEMPESKLTKEALDEVIEMLRMDRLERKLSSDMLKAIAEIGLHKDMVQKLSFVLKKKAGVQALLQLSPRQIVDTETVVQTLLQVYDEVVSGE